MSIEGQGHFFTIFFFQVLYVLCFTEPRYQVSVYRTIGPLVLIFATSGKYQNKEKPLKRQRKLGLPNAMLDKTCNQFPIHFFAIS